MQYRALALIMLSLSAACSQAGELTETARLPIIGGVDSTAADDAVVLVYRKYPAASVCTGTLLAPNLVVTARHCIVAVSPTDGFVCQPDGTLLHPEPGQPGELGDSSPPDAIQIFTGSSIPSQNFGPAGAPAATAAKILTTTGPSICRDDLAFVVLDTDLPLPTIQPRLDRRVATYDTVSTLGYGWTETTAAGTLYSTTRRRRDGVRVQATGILPSTFTVGRSACKGDSGGPALDSKSGSLVGVYSLGFPGDSVAACSSEEAVNYYVQLADYPDLINQAFTAAGHPLPDAGSGAGGGTTSGQGGAGGAATGAGSTSGAGGAGGAPSTSGDIPAPAASCAIGRPPGGQPLSLLGALGLQLLLGWRRHTRRRQGTSGRARSGPAQARRDLA